MFLLTVILVEERVQGKIGLAHYKRELIKMNNANGLIGCLQLKPLLGRGWRRGHVQPHGAHQFERVALFDDAGPQLVIEAHPAVLKLVLEMEILTWRFQLFDDAG